MTALSRMSDPTATSRIHLFVALAVGFLACLSGLVPAAFLLLAM